MRRAAASGGLILGVIFLLSCGTLGSLYWAARLKLDDRARWIEKELDRRSLAASSVPPLDWPPYLGLRKKLQENPKVIPSELGTNLFDSEDFEEIGRWRAAGCSFRDWMAHTDVGFRNRHHVAVWGGFRKGGVERIHLQLCLAQDFFRGGGLSCTLLRASNEQWIHYHSRGAFQASPPDPEGLTACAEALDLLESRRPSLQEEYEIEHLLRCRDLLQVYRSGQDPEHLIPDPIPGLRFCHSRTVLFFRALQRLDQERDRMMVLLSQPPGVWWREFRSLPTNTPPLSACFAWVDQFVLAAEARSACHRQLLRTAVAIARFAAEEGRLPERLEDLVPRYLGEVPLCPLTGNRLTWSGGTLKADVDDDMAEWTIRPPDAREN